jgi:hypothetical protein
MRSVRVWRTRSSPTTEKTKRSSDDPGLTRSIHQSLQPATEGRNAPSPAFPIRQLSAKSGRSVLAYIHLHKGVGVGRRSPPRTSGSLEYKRYVSIADL